MRANIYYIIYIIIYNSQILDNVNGTDSDSENNYAYQYHYSLSVSTTPFPRWKPWGNQQTCFVNYRFKHALKRTLSSPVLLIELS